MATRLGVEPELFIYALAVFSPRVSVSRAARMAVEFCKNPQQRPHGCMNSVYKTALRYIDTMELNGKKTENFRRSILAAGKSDALCLDIWMAKLFNVEQSKLYNKSVYPKIRRTMQRTANKLNLSMSECQAAVWTGYVDSVGYSNEKRRLIPDDVLNAV